MIKTLFGIVRNNREYLIYSLPQEGLPCSSPTGCHEPHTTADNSRIQELV
jgi:hypothetical protein